MDLDLVSRNYSFTINTAASCGATKRPGGKNLIRQDEWLMLRISKYFITMFIFYMSLYLLSSLAEKNKKKHLLVVFKQGFLLRSCGTVSYY